MKRYIRMKGEQGHDYEIRMVNQLEIVDYLSKNPMRTETQIMFDIYGFTRGGFGSNKKYAECLRRALRSGKIDRKILIGGGSRSKYIYYAIPVKMIPTCIFSEWLKKG